ncbi:MAG: biotin/lipoyl-binding protein [Candidatus Gracilibacteria bacterium]|nr:biotin/lipoyl-binding protein [Candidatus Gracilibacteria bacterium]
MKKIISVIILSSFILTSCGTKELTNTEDVKKDFYIDVKKVSELDNIAYINKTGKLDSTQNISLSSNANGRVKSILVKSGDNVSEGQALAILDDSVANYNLTFESAENNLAASKNNLEVVKNGLETVKNNLEKAKLNYESTKNKLDKAVSDIQRNLGNLQLTDNTTSTSIELDKLDNTISKLNGDYANLQSSNNETLSGFTRSLDKELVVLKNYVSDIIYFSDDILGVTEANKNKNNSYEIYLGAKDLGQKIESEQLLSELINYKKNTLDNFQIGELSTNDDYKNKIDVINSSYSKIIKFLNSFDSTIANTVSSFGTLSDTQIAGYKATIGGYKTTYNAYNSGFIALSNSIYSFLETYKNNQSSLLKQIENLGKDKEIYLKSLDLNKDSSQASLDEAISNRDITLKNLDLVINDANSAIRDAEIRITDAQIRVRDAEISYKKALNEVEKLTIKSPITGIVGDILIDKGQEINNGTPAFNLLSEGQKEVTISFNKDELDFVSENMNAYYSDGVNTFTGKIYSISKNADSTLKYLAKVTMPSDASSIGNILNLNIPIELSHKLMPVNAVKINSSGLGTINYFSTGSTIEQKDIEVGTIYGDKIEILGNLEDNLNIILNYVDNYDSEKFTLKIKE